MNLIDSKKDTKLRMWLKDAETAHDDLLTRAYKNRMFRQGKQWTTEELELYNKKRIEPITVNHILPVTNALSGAQRQDKQDIKARPRRNAAEQVASILTELVKHTMDMSEGEHAVSEWYSSSLSDIQTFMRVEVSKETPGGQINLYPKTIFECLPDPAAVEYDLNKSGRYVIEREWVDQDWAKAKYKEALAEYTKELDFGDFDSKVDQLSRELSNGISDTTWLFPDDGDLEDYREKHRYLKYTFWWIDYEENAEKVLHKTVYINDVPVEDQASPYGEDFKMLPFIRMAPYFEGGYAYGVIDNLVGPQREENINRTQMVRLMHQTANGGWIVKKCNAIKRAFLEAWGSITGIVIAEDDYGGKVEKIQPNQISTGHAALSELARTDIKEISSATDALMGYDTGEKESGRAIELKRRQGMIALEPIMDNLDRSMKLLGGMIIHIIRKHGVYTPEEIFSIISSSKLITKDMLIQIEETIPIKPIPPQEPPAPDPERLALLNIADQMKVKRAYAQAMQRYQFEANRFPAIMKKWIEIVAHQAAKVLVQKFKEDEGEYGITISLSPMAPTIQLANVIELSEISRNYPGEVPIEVFIENSGLTNKEEIAAKVSQYKQLIAQSAQRKEAAA
jgi:hypothetical protein